MRWGIKWLLALVLVFVASFSEAGTQMIEDYKVKTWSVGAYSDDQNFSFSHCAMATSYNSGVTLLFSVDKSKSWSMALTRSDWKLKVGEKYYFNVFLDNASGDKWFGYAITPTLIKIPLSTNSTTFGNFRRSKFLTVVAPNGRFSFSLDNSSEALIALVACVRKHLSSDETITNPFEAKKSPITTPHGSEDLYAEAAITSTNLLASMGGSYRLLPLDKVKTDFAGEHAVWVVAGTIG